MPSLLTSPKLGNTGVSSLVKSAQTLRNTVTANQDAVAKITWENSGYTDAAFADYSAYLRGRITTLNSTGSVSDNTKAINISQELQTANHSNISYQISQENDALMMSGDAGTSAGYAQKMDVLASQYNRAISIGDQTLANSLQTQYLSTSQSYQAAIQSEGDAATTLYKSNEAAIKQGYTDALGSIKDGLNNLMANIKNPLEQTANTATSTAGGTNDVKKSLSNFVTQNKATYDALGIKLPSGSNLTVGNLLEASFNAEYQYNLNAAHALGGSPSDAAKFAKFDANGNVVGGEALKVLNGTSYYNVPGLGNINYRDARQMSLSPNAVREVTVNGQTKFAWNAIVGYKMAPDGQPMNVYSADGSSTTKNPNAIINQLKAAGFSDVTYDKKNNTFSTTMSAASDHWLTQHGLNQDLSSGSGKNSDQAGVGNSIRWQINANGGLDAITSGNRLVHLAFDTNGRTGLFQTMPDGSTKSLTGQYGFNQKVNTMISNATVTQIRDRIANQNLTAMNAHANSGTQGLIGGPNAPIAGSFMSLHPNAGPVTNGYIGPKVAMTQRAGGGYNFTQNGHAISAARYAQLTGTPFRTLLQTMASSGDSGAKSALGFVGNDFGYDPGKIAGQANVYNALTWGVKPSAGGVPSAPTQGVKGPASPVSLGGLHL